MRKSVKFPLGVRERAVWMVMVPVQPNEPFVVVGVHRPIDRLHDADTPCILDSQHEHDAGVQDGAAAERERIKALSGRCGN